MTPYASTPCPACATWTLLADLREREVDGRVVFVCVVCAAAGCGVGREETR